MRSRTSCKELQQSGDSIIEKGKDQLQKQANQPYQLARQVKN